MPHRELIALSTPPLHAKFMGDGRQPKCAPDPNFPDGKPIDASMGAPGCSIELTHPTPECGIWLILCDLCRTNTVVTAAARPDDPSKVTLPCKVSGEKQ